MCWEALLEMADKDLLKFETVVANPGLLSLAARQLDKRVSDNPSDTNAIWQLAETYRKLGELEKAAELYSTLCQVTGQGRLVRDLLAVTGGNPQDFVGQDGCYPVPFVIRNNYLADDELSMLCDYVSAEAWESCQPSKVGKGKHDDTLRRSFDLAMPDWLKKKMRQEIVGHLPDLACALNIAGEKFDRIDLSLRSYGDGHFFGIHTDKSSKIQRLLSLTYFFFIEPKSFTGGDLLIFDTDVGQSEHRAFSESFTRLQARQNSLVVFPSASYHAVSTVNAETGSTAHYRYAVNGHVWEQNSDEQ
ncbi:Fe(II)-dependent oxygenase superfamily protein [Sphingorhabdus sp. SMR4y]|nr:Fe(II)-dependent oxygenase superfamily protein [Sphingorhabdus sp. SMR4y]